MVTVRENKKGKRKSSDANIQTSELYWAVVSLINYR